MLRNQCISLVSEIFPLPNDNLSVLGLLTRQMESSGLDIVIPARTDLLMDV